MQVERLGDLFSVISGIYIRKTDGQVEALIYDPKSGVWVNLDDAEYEVANRKFRATRVACGVSHRSPYRWHCPE